MSKADRKKAIKNFYIEQNKLCFWCQKEMIPPGTKYHKHMPDEYCTFDHMFDKNDPRRGIANREFKINVAACSRCNNFRSKTPTSMTSTEFIVNLLKYRFPHRNFSNDIIKLFRT